MTDIPEDLLRFTDLPIALPGGGAMIINPGTGPVPGATEADATVAIRAFVEDLARRGWMVDDVRPAGEPVEGRYPFRIRFADRRVVNVDMPGLPVEQVRYLGEDQDPWQYPRLYVDGDSWLWSFAVDMCAPGANDAEAGQ